MRVALYQDGRPVATPLQQAAAVNAQSMCIDL